MKKTAKKVMKSSVKRFSNKTVRKAVIAPFGSIGVDLDPNSPLWANRQISALNSAMGIIEHLDLNGKELEFLRDTFLPQLISERSPDFKRLVLARSPEPKEESNGHREALILVKKAA